MISMFNENDVFIVTDYSPEEYQKLIEKEMAKGADGAKEAMKRALLPKGWLGKYETIAIIYFYILKDLTKAEFFYTMRDFSGYIYPEPEGVHTWVSDLMEEKES